MKITNPELFRNALKFNLVGTRNVLSPHKFFQFNQTLKNVVMNSESALWIFFGKHLFFIFQKDSRRDLGQRHFMGGPPGWQAKEEEHHRAPPGTPIWHIPFMKWIKWGHFVNLEFNR
jgi:hypothetical protein